MFLKKLMRASCLIAILMPFLFSTTVFAKQSTTDLNFECSLPVSPTQELKNIRAAPYNVKRLDHKRLQIRWKTGARTYLDITQPDSYEDPFGLRWRYCGYIPQFGYHLIAKISDVFTGILVNAETGKELPGGESILISFKHKQYLAYEHEDGMEGLNIALYDFNGSQLWHGFNGILYKDRIIATFDSVRWDEAARLQAEAKCWATEKPSAWLTLADNSLSWYGRAKSWAFSTGWSTDTPSWEWQPKLKCQNPK